MAAIGKELHRVWNAPADGKAAEAELGHLVAAYRELRPHYFAIGWSRSIPFGFAVFTRSLTAPGERHAYLELFMEHPSSRTSPRTVKVGLS